MKKIFCIVFLFCNAYTQQPPALYFSVLSFDLKKIVNQYLRVLPGRELDEIIDRNDEEEIACKELWLFRLANPPSYLRTNFHISVEKKLWNSAALFLRWGVNPSYYGDGCPALCGAVEDNNTQIMQSLFKAGAKPKESEQYRCWESAAKKGSGQMITLLVEKGGMSPNYDLSGYSVLQVAARNRNLEAVAALVAAGADVNYKHPCWHTALWQAACDNNVPLARLLLESGAVTHKDSFSPLAKAAIEGHDDMIKLLLPYCNPIDPIDLKQESALEFAARHSRVGVVKLLLLAGADPERKTKGNAIECAFIAFQWCKKPQEVRAAQRVFVRLLTHIQANSSSKNNNCEHIIAQHDRFCMQKWSKPKRCHFCEFVPELKKRFGALQARG